MRVGGIEPPRLAPADFKSAVFTYFTTLAYLAEGVGVEPTQQFNPLYGLAIRCLTVRPALRYLVKNLMNLIQ